MNMEEVKEFKMTRPEFEEAKKAELSRFEKLKYMIKNITIEPALFLLITGVAAQMITYENLLIEKVCLTINGLSEKICSQIQDKANDEYLDAVQKNVTTWKTVISLSSAIPSVVYSIMVGSWSDKHGRKTFMVLPLIGMVLTNAMYILSSYYLWSPVYYFALVQFGSSLFGGYGFFVCMLAYIMDVSSERYRTVRIAITEGCAIIGAPLGMMLSSALFKSYGYIAVFAFSMGCLVLSALYTIFLVKESKTDIVPSSMGQKIKDLISVQTIKESFRAFRAQKGRNKQKTMILILITIMIISFANEGAMKVKILFTQKMFHWNIEEFSNFESIAIGLIVLFITLFVIFFSKILKFKDSKLGFAASCFTLIGFTLEGNSVVPWLFYIGSVLAGAHVMMTITFKSRISKIVDEKDIGKIVSFLTCFERIAPILADATCPLIYGSTLDVYPGLIFFILAVLLVFPFGLYLWLLLQEQNEKDTEHKMLIRVEDEIVDIQ